MQPFKYNPNFNSGQFRNRITFLKPETVEDELGQEDTTWIDYKKAWAMIKTVKGSEYVSAGAEHVVITSRFIIHYTEGITADMRIDYNGRIFDIIEPPINDDELNKTLTILAKERV
ncbi:phage head closure protein [Neobacillus sp. MM2021_6]|uniref:phage head closure protein n=1 Tax=Bacillaceae TaxID=186817 RepID=UPI00140DCD7C|nr:MULTISPECIES: phage head closure protein [Bacillaceae]MBO0961445.1 phage head closure protein [Neobacillus sp. MM2021_6]NHC19550.1 phage head closure protein [Bacillus sp. MM2020_4]